MPHSRPKLYDFYTLSQTNLPENHTFHSNTYHHSLYLRVAPTPPSLGLNPTFGLLAACDELNRITSFSENKFQQI